MKNKMIRRSRIIILLGILIILVLLIFCYKTILPQENSTISNAKNIGGLNLSNPNEYYIEKSFGKALDLENPEGIAYYKGYLFICDTGNDRVIILDSHGELIKIIGETGNAKGEFIRPRGITIDNEGNILVADSGNSRIQVFDPKGNYKEGFNIGQFKLESTQSEYIRDVEIDNKNNIYVSTFSFDKTKANIFVYKNNRILNTINCGMSGLLCNCNGQIFFLNDFELIKEKNRIRLSPGKSYLCKVNTKKIEFAYRLPDSSSPKSICFYRNKYFLLFKSMPNIDIYNSLFSFEKTAYYLKWKEYSEYRGFIDMVIDEEGHLYCVDQNNNEICILQKNNRGESNASVSLFFSNVNKVWFA